MTAQKIGPSHEALRQEQDDKDEDEAEYDEMGLSQGIGEYLRQHDEEDASHNRSEQGPRPANDNREQGIECPTKG